MTRSLTLAQVKDLQSGWHHANKIGLPIEPFHHVRPNDINDQSPEQRVKTWTIWRNKLAQFARDHDFDFTCLWTRESQRSTALNEHMHVLMHVPRHLLPRFDKVVKGWCGATGEIDVRRWTNRKGSQSNVLTYVTKNSPQAGRFLQRITSSAVRSLESAMASHVTWTRVHGPRSPPLPSLRQWLAS